MDNNQENNNRIKVQTKIIIGKYKRCSTNKGELTLQEEVLEKFVRRLKEDNPHIEYETLSFEDQAISGKTKDRPGLNSLLELVESGKINLVMFTKLDRLGRSLQDLLEITSMFEKKGVDFVAVEQSLDTSTPQGKLLFQIMGAFAEFERTIIRERMEAGRKRAEITGTKSGKPCHRPKIKIDEDGVKYKYKQGKSMHTIAKEYNVSITPIRRILSEANLI
jgi:DNA invertase Pin-like site-specific DNA recombinase